MIKYAPVWSPKDEPATKLVIAAGNMFADTEEDAKVIGYGAMLVEGIFLGLENTFEVIKLDEDVEFPHVRAELVGGPMGRVNVYIFAGPVMDEARAKGELPSPDKPAEAGSPGEKQPENSPVL